MRDASGSEFAVLFIIETRFGITGTGVWHRNGKMHENAKNGNVKETYRTYCGKQTSLVTHNTDLILKKKNQKIKIKNPQRRTHSSPLFWRVCLILSHQRERHKSNHGKHIISYLILPLPRRSSAQPTVPHYPGDAIVPKTAVYHAGCRNALESPTGLDPRPAYSSAFYCGRHPLSTKLLARDCPARGPCKSETGRPINRHTA